jgi:hypothetical protein
MRIFFLATFSIFAIQLFAQVSTGNREIFSREETEFLNDALKDSRDTFDFTDKHIAFVTGSMGNRLLSRQKYFETIVDPMRAKGDKPQISMIQLTEAEKKKSGGYDAIVFSWTKVLTNKQRRKLIARLGKETITD